VLIAGTNLLVRTIDGEDIFTFLDDRLGERSQRTTVACNKVVSIMNPLLLFQTQGQRNHPGEVNAQG